MFAPQLLLAFALQTGNSSALPTISHGTPLSPRIGAAVPGAPSQPDADGVYRHPGRDIVMARLVHNVEPEFSEQARKKKLSAVVLIELVVDTEGMPQDVHVARSAAESAKKPEDKPAYETLDAKAIEAVEQYRFAPATKDGRPVRVLMHAEINFQHMN